MFNVVYLSNELNQERFYSSEEGRAHLLHLIGLGISVCVCVYLMAVLLVELVVLGQTCL